MKQLVLQINDLKTYFFGENGVIPAVDGVTFHLREGETLGIVGESGCGKSITALSIMGLIDPPGRTEGEVLYFDRDLLKTRSNEMRKIIGRDITMIFQEPLTALNPVFRVGDQIQEALLNHRKMSKAEARKHTLELLRKVRIPRPESVYNAYPHQLSGGMRQRTLIAMAMSCDPKVLIADEPTTALDVSIQAQILQLIKDIIKNGSSSILLITHDLGVIAEMADRVIVMYAGQIVEQCDVFTLFKEPKHPYIQGLLRSTPKLHNIKEKLDSIEGSVPNPLYMPEGCRFHPRCSFAMEKCSTHKPQLNHINSDHQVRCLMYKKEFKQDWTKRGGDVDAKK